MNFRSRYTKDYEGYTKRQVEIDTSASLTSNDQKSKTNVHYKYIERERELFFFFILVRYLIYVMFFMHVYLILRENDIIYGVYSDSQYPNPRK